MQTLCLILTMATLCATIAAFGGSEDKFLKKYAMMKIYESCFGPEVVKQIRKEMKAACAKCAAVETPPPAPTKDGIASGAVIPPQPGFDSEKLHQAILAYRPNASPNPYYRPYQAGVSPFYSLPYVNPTYPLLYPGIQPQASQYPGFGAMPLVGQPYYASRVSRDMDIKSQIEALTSKMSNKVKNVTCVMQELGYLDENLEPNFKKITERVGTLPVSDELKKDIQEGVAFCQQFSQCVPEVKRDKAPLSRELIRPMFFFKCYKHKKLEACIMKDVREKYSGVADDELDNDVELRRTGKEFSLPQSEMEINELASSMYEFLYGSESNVEMDAML